MFIIDRHFEKNRFSHINDISNVFREICESYENINSNSLRAFSLVMTTKVCGI